MGEAGVQQLMCKDENNSDSSMSACAAALVLAELSKHALQQKVADPLPSTVHLQLAEKLEELDVLDEPLAPAHALATLATCKQLIRQLSTPTQGTGQNAAAADAAAAAPAVNSAPV